MNKKNNKGITLVALVITIIILLILVGIVIRSISNTGLLERTNEAKTKTDEEEEKQQEILGNYETEIDKYLKDGESDLERLQKYFSLGEKIFSETGEYNNLEPIMDANTSIKNIDFTESDEGEMVAIIKYNNNFYVVKYSFDAEELVVKVSKVNLDLSIFGEYSLEDNLKVLVTPSTPDVLIHLNYAFVTEEESKDQNLYYLKEDGSDYIDLNRPFIGNFYKADSFVNGKLYYDENGNNIKIEEYVN